MRFRLNVKMICMTGRIGHKKGTVGILPPLGKEFAAASFAPDVQNEMKQGVRAIRNADGVGNKSNLGSIIDGEWEE
jgi:hypothetical protein